MDPPSAFQKLKDCGITDRRNCSKFHNSVFLNETNISYLIQIFEPVDDKYVSEQKINQ